MQLTPVRTKLFVEGDDLIDFLNASLPSLPEGSILVIASKIVALAEGRSIELPSSRMMTKLIQNESAQSIKTKHVWLTVKDNMVMANAGIDESNADGRAILLPKDSFQSAKEIRHALRKAHGIKRLGVIIADSCPLPLRAGVTSLALGFSGFKSTRDYRGKKDLFGRTLQMTRTNMADGLAAAAGVVMGEGAERQPLVLITDAPVTFSERGGDLSIPRSEDMYYPLFKKAGL